MLSITKLLSDFVYKYDKGGTEQVINVMTGWLGKILTLTLVALLSYCIYKFTIDDEYVDSSSYPVAAADFMLEEEKKGNLNFETMKLYNDYNYGSYLLYRDIPVFIDSRADLYSPEFNEGVNIFDDYMNISSIAAYYEIQFEKYGITHAMMYKNSKLNMLISRDKYYKNIYTDDNFVIYERLIGTMENNESK